MKDKKNSRVQSSPTPSRPEPETDSDPPNSSTLCTIVGIGASAGGLEAFKELLENLPGDTGAAFVLIQHLDPKHVSMLGELLAKATGMPVQQVTDNMEILPNHVYVIPPNMGLTLTGSAFVLTQRPLGSPHMAIDEFFRSLAEQEGNRAIAVLLSGNGPDGTLGMKAIKGAGGITIAQDQSAKYDAMPRNATAAGWVDVVLAPHLIADELVRLCRHPYINRPVAPPGAVDERKEPDDGIRFLEILTMLRTVTGVDFTLYKHGTVRRRIERRMALKKFDSEEQYARRLRDDRAELKALFHDILISVTGFFRESGTFDGLKKLVFPALLQDRPPEDPVRIWVPGCSTGEDPYSVAICLLEYLRDSKLDVAIQIFGTDLSEPALERARMGVYPESIALDVTPERLRRFFQKVDGQFQISRSVRDLCIFAQQNLTKDPPFSKLDLILCRNVLIYLGPTLQNRVMRFFHYGLKPSGFLVLGLSETVGNAQDLFAPIDRRLKIYSRSSVPAPVSVEFSRYDDSRPDSEAPKNMPSPTTDLQRRVDQFILSRYSPAGVLVDSELNILQFHGHTSPYLEHGSGEPILTLNRMLREELSAEFRKVFDRARKKQTAAEGDLIAFPHLERMHRVRISVTPMLLAGESLDRYLVLFEEYPPAPEKPAKTNGDSVKAPKPVQRVRDLEQELTAIKQYLESVIEEHQATTEELKSANEEVQSSNEELQSTNEELLTAKEELQSTNEELTTVNEEMHSRNSELAQINNDLNNLLSSVNIPIVMVSNDLRIRRFTPQAESVLNLLPSDVGRPIGDFKPKIDIPDLDRIFLDVIESLRVREREVQDREGRWFSMWVRPYRTSENRIDGAVMVLFDVTDRKYAAEARYRRLFEAARDGIILADGETGEVIDLNPYMAKTFSVSRSASVGFKYWDLDVFKGTDLNEASFRELQEAEFIQRTIVITSKSGGQAAVEALGNVYLEGNRRVVQLNLRDVSERRRRENGARRLQEGESQRLETMARVAGGLALDFNNLLTAVVTQTELLRRRLDGGPNIADDMDQLNQALERAGRLTRQFRLFEDRQILEPESIDLNEVINGMQQIIRPAMSDAINLTLELDPATRRARADRTQIEQLLLHLAVNARAAVSAGGGLRITTSNYEVDGEPVHEHPAVPPGEYALLEISVRNSSAATEAQSLFFQPFFAAKRAPEATGVPLSDIYAKVRQFGGHIWAASELGRGGTLRVFLPHAEGPPVELESRGGALPRGSETILLAEHDGMLRHVMARLLADLGYNVIEATNSTEALKLAAEKSASLNLVLVDVLLPSLTGPQLLKEIRALSPQMRGLLMSGPAEEMLLPDRNGIEDRSVILQKPFRPETLSRRLREILD